MALSTCSKKFWMSRAVRFSRTPCAMMARMRVSTLHAAEQCLVSSQHQVSQGQLAFGNKLLRQDRAHIRNWTLSQQPLEQGFTTHQRKV